MKNTSILIVFTALATCLSSFGAPKISGNLRILSPITDQEVSSVRVGDTVKIVVTERDLSLLANKTVTLNYVLSVVPKGINNPITLSGKITGKVTLLPADGGATETAAKMAALAGSQTAEGLVTVPDSMPEGVATLTVVIGTKEGFISIRRSIKITL
jgi:hypothetical protein